MKKRTFIKKGLLGTAAAATILASCDNANTSKVPEVNIITNKKYSWRMATVWGKNFPVFGEAANKVADWVSQMSAGRLTIKIYGGGELAPGLESFDITSEGVTDMGAGAAYYWVGKIPEAVIYAGIPFGMNAQQLNAWMFGGAQEGYQLWKKAYEKFNLIPFFSGNSGVQMGGWFNKKIETAEDIKGLKMRIPGLGGKVLDRAGGAAMNIPGGEIYTSLERGVIDATEWVGPYHDYKLGLYKVAKYYYTPGWHEPGTILEFFANKKAFEKLPKDLQIIVETATIRAHNWVLAEFEAQNAIYLNKLINEHQVNIQHFPQEVLSVFRNHTAAVIEDLRAKDAGFKNAHDSYQSFFLKIQKWSKISEQNYFNNIANK